jgi:hypothetical protein
LVALHEDLDGLPYVLGVCQDLFEELVGDVHLLA